MYKRTLKNPTIMLKTGASLTAVLIVMLLGPIACRSALPECGAGQERNENIMIRSFNGGDYRVAPIFEESFDSFDNWVTFSGTSRWWVEDGSMFGHWAAGGGGSNVWCRRNFEGDVLVEFRARLLSPDQEWVYPGRPHGGKNINIRLHVEGPNGEDILDVAERLQEEGTGPNRIGDDQYRGYFFTWTFRHARLRRSPGYENVSENLDILPEVGPWYTISVLRTGNRLRYFVDGRMVHDYSDPDPFDRGKIGFALWHSRVEIDSLAVFRVLEH